MEDLIPALAICSIFLGLPWIIFHYITKWKTSASLTNEDESMLDQMNDTARRLEERLATIERIITADNPDFRPSLHASRSGSDDDYRIDRRN